MTIRGQRWDARRAHPKAASGAPSPPAFVGIVDALIAAGGTVNCAFSCGYQIDTAGGDYVTVRRASDNATAPIAVNTTTHLLDAAALATHCGASDGFAVTLHDRSGNVRDLTNATTTEQPQVYNGATGIVLTGSLPMALLDGGAGTAGTGDGWTRGDSAGFSGTQAVCVWYFGSFTDVATTARTAVAIGTLAGTVWSFRHLVALDAGMNNQDGSASGNYRVFGETTSLATPSDFRVQLASGAAISAAEMWQRGSALAQSAVNSSAGPNISNTGFSIGANNLQARGVTGRFSAAIALGVLPNAAQVTLLDAFGATLRTTAGV